MNAVACVLSSFPTLTETFVVGEILELRQRGIPILLFALRRSRAGIAQPEAAALTREVTYAAPIAAPRLLRSNAAWLRRHPRRYLGALALLVHGSWRNPIHLLKTLYLFPKAVELADRMLASDARHVHAHWATYPTTVALVVSELTGLPYSFSAHAGDVSLFRTLLADKLHRASFVVACTGELQAELARLLPAHARGKVHLNYHGVVPERFDPARGAATAGDVPTIMACGALYERKGFADLVDACAILRNRGRRFHCVLVGDGPQRRLLEARIRDQGLEPHVRLLGAVPQAEVIQRYRESDVFVLPCALRPVRLWDREAGLVKALEAWFEPAGGVIKDGIPNVLVEAMAAGLPVVTTPIAGIPELVRDGSTGLLVPPHDPPRLAEAIDRLLLDPDLRQQLGGRAAAEVRERFDRCRTIVSLADVFRRWAGRPASPAPRDAAERLWA